MKRLLGILILAGACSGPDTPPLGTPDAALDDVGETRDGGPSSATDMGDANTFDAAPDTASDAASDEDVADLPADPPDPISFADYCDAISRTYLTWLANCYGSASYDPNDPESRARFAAGCFEAEESINAGRIDYDGVQAARCIDALEAATCDQFMFFEREPSCDGVTSGAQGESELCYSAVARHFSVERECADGYCTFDSCPGECAPYVSVGDDCLTARCDPATSFCNFNDGRCDPLVQLGGDCGAAGCVPGLQCSPASQTCIAPADFGEACDDMTECIFGTFCAAGICRSKVARGEPCQFPHHCPEGDVCRDPDGPGFGTENGVCEAPGTDGSPCFDAGECAAGYVCPQGTCVALPVGGAPCDSAGRCGVDHWCRYDQAGAGTCRPLGAVGEDCTDGNGDTSARRGCQDGLFCLGGVCAPPGGADEPCSTDVQETCQTSLFCSRTTQTCQPRAQAGMPCNPFWTDTCADGLGCACAQQDATCEFSEFDANPGDTCQTLAPLGATCWRSAECESGSCFDDDMDGTPTCLASECLP